MIINHNMNALNAHRNMTGNTTQAGKSMEKLSSGLRINRAGDDAAGLAISEKMRGQIRGLDQASRNSQDGISLIQTAEGALNETHSILQRMRELSVQSANDTNTADDRAEIQKEIAQLTEEIDRIGNNTEFNTQKLLQGDGGVDLGKTNADITTADGTVTHANAKTTITTVRSSAAGNGSLTFNINGEEIKINVKEDTTANTTQDSAAVDATSLKGNEITINTNGTADANKMAAALKSALESVVNNNETLKGNVTIDANNADVTIELTNALEGKNGTISAGTVTGTGTGMAANAAAVGTTTEGSATSEVDFNKLAGANADETKKNLESLIGKGIEVNGTKIEFYNVNDGAYKGEALGIDISKALESAGADADDVLQDLTDTIVKQIGDKIEGITVDNVNTGIVQFDTVAKGEDAKIDVKDGATKKDFTANFQVGANEGQSISVSIGDMRAEALEVNTLDISTKESAEKAITSVDEAIKKVSGERAKLGAVQNRLEHTINNLNTSSENLTAAESRVRDVDMAKEMMTFSKNNILSQAAQAMLAQANQQPQGVLQLLR